MDPELKPVALSWHPFLKKLYPGYLIWANVVGTVFSYFLATDSILFINQFVAMSINPLESFLWTSASSAEPDHMHLIKFLTLCLQNGLLKLK